MPGQGRGPFLILIDDAVAFIVEGVVFQCGFVLGLHRYVRCTN